jgi:hypothetical protein
LATLRINATIPAGFNPDTSQMNTFHFDKNKKRKIGSKSTMVTSEKIMQEGLTQ